MKLTGVLPALMTPLDKNEELNVPVLEKYIDYLISEGADGFYIGGASGEGVLLPMKTRMALAESAVGHTNGRVPTIVHIGSIVFKEALELARHAESIGATAVSSIPPLYFKYGNDSIYEYYERLAGATSLPLVIYNTPAAGYLLDGELAAKLCEIPNVQAVKWTSPRYDEFVRLRKLTNGEITLFNGPDETALSGLASGADGLIGVSYSIALKTAKTLYNAFRNGDLDTARAMQTKLCDLVGKVYRKCPSIVTVKAVLESRGFDFGDAVFPQRRLSSEEKREIAAQVEEILK